MKIGFVCLAVMICSLIFASCAQQSGNVRPTPGDSTEAYASELLLFHGCNLCHTTDGSKSKGPSLKGLFGKKQVIITDGKEQEITVDEAYLSRAILNPKVDIVKGYPPIMLSTKEPITEGEVAAIVDYIKTLK